MVWGGRWGYRGYTGLRVSSLEVPGTVRNSICLIQVTKEGATGLLSRKFGMNGMEKKMETTGIMVIT